MADRDDDTIRFKGKQHQVLERVRIRGQMYFVIGRIGRNGRIRLRALERFGRNQHKLRSIHVLPKTVENKKRIQNLDRAAGSNLPLARIISFAESREDLKVVMEWIPGQSLRSYFQEISMGKRPRISPLMAIQMHCGFVSQVRTLESKFGIFHGDISPENIIIAPNNHRLVLIDFGSSFRFTEIADHDEGDGAKELYRAPEQFHGQPADQFSEQFSSTMVFYEMLTGALPYNELGGTIQRESREGDEIKLDRPSKFNHAKNSTLPKNIWKLIDQFTATGLALTPEERFPTSNDWISAAQNMRDQAKYNPANNPTSGLLSVLYKWWDKRPNK